MKKLKPKYRYSDRAYHLICLNFQWQFGKMIHEAAFFGKQHWTAEELEKLKSSAHTSAVSALEKEAGTTNPATNESSHTTGGIVEFISQDCPSMGKAAAIDTNIKRE